MTSNETETANNHASGTTVWDPVVRFGHWALVVAFAIAYLSAEEEAGGPDVLHVWGGCCRRYYHSSRALGLHRV